MVNRVASNGTGLREKPAAPLTPFRDLLGLDPFRDMMSAWNVDYGVTRTESGYEVEVPVPGYKPDEIEIAYQNSIITITGKSERRSFTRSLTIPDDINDEAIQADVANGMLRLTLTRLPEAQPKKINVTSRG